MLFAVRIICGLLLIFFIAPLIVFIDTEEWDLVVNNSVVIGLIVCAWLIAEERIKDRRAR